MKLLFLTVMPSPYQRQLFSGLAAAENVDLAVRYYTVAAQDREWSRPAFDPHEAVLPGHVIGALGPSAYWNNSVIKELKTINADLVIVSDYSAPTAQLAMRWLAKEERPFAFWGEVPGFSNRGVIGRFIRRRLQAPLANAAAIVSIGTRAEETYRSIFPEVPTFNIPYFCDLAPYTAAARKARAVEPSPGVRVLFSGQLIPRKGADTLIRAFTSIADELPELHLDLLGNGPEKDRLVSLIPDNLRYRINFLGHKDPADLPTLFAAADVFCLPSRHDGWGVVVNEALGAGLPIIATESTGAAIDIVETGKNGYLIPKDDVSALAAAIRALAEQGVRKRMSAAAFAAADNWGLDEGVSRWFEVASKIVGERPIQ